jgi:streptomycin 6-kinase
VGGPLDPTSLELAAREVADEWELELGQQFALALHSFVAAAGAEAVLKVVPERHWESEHEPDALAHWSGDGAVRLLRQDRVRRAFLIERARPGTDLSSLPDAEATAIAVDVGRRLWRPAGGPFRRVGDELPRWLDEAEGELRAKAEALLAHMELRHELLVHGDFHHHNLLASARGHLAIDPQPFLGEPEYDVVPFLWNPLPIGIRPELLPARLAAFAAAGLDEERMRAWMVIRGSYLLPEQADALLALV